MRNSFLLFLEFILLYFIFLIVNCLPINFVSKFGGYIFKLIGLVSKKNIIVTNNLKKIFPFETNKDINKKARKSWFNMGKTFFELLILSKIINKKNKIFIEGKKYLNKIIQNKEKVIFVTIHQSNWEIVLPSIDKIGIPLGGIYRHINNYFINNLILKIRNKSIKSNKSYYTPKGKKSAKDILKGLKNNISILALIDQKDSAGETIDFFNYPTKTQIGFIKIARKHNIKIIMVQNIRNHNNSFTLKFHKPLENFNHRSDKEVMKSIHLIIEDWIKSDPSSWLLQHNRFN